ncbi:bifunctional diguanylate cyclase/phosphodiesterase [Aliidiomarina quisquiliarum]|uniref:sensor domain-containing protein n=1 Tax=Aliidiomarina quisquiliarum TaxID=2938947 RepID=UPI00208DF311|nr:PAS domain-containing protein [Aliidiomarina quisquiliarum]MCO4320084.1 PAS domain-containing protein [Aliidiomarina quisquiliarum]
MKSLNVDESSAVLYSMKIKNNVAIPEWVSENVEKVTGYSPAQVIQPAWWNKCIHPDDQQIEVDVNEKLISEGYITYEYRFMFANGKYHWLRDEMRVIHNDEQDHIEILGVWRDITEERNSKAKLLAHEERLRFVFEATGDGFWDWNINDHIVLFSDNCWHLLGLKPTADGLFPFELWHQLVHPDDSAHVQEAANRIFNNESDRYNVEYRMRHKNGSWVWILARGQVIQYDSNMVPVRAIGLLTDITERKLNEQTALTREHMLNQLAHQVPGMLYQFVHRADGTPCMPYASDKIEQLYHVTADQVKEDATVLAKHIHPDDLVELRQSILESARTLAVWRHMYRTVDNNGVASWIKGEASPERLNDGSVVWCGYKMDITAERVIEQQQKLAANVFIHTHEGIMVTDANKTIIEVNPMFTSITGYQRSEAIGQHASFLASGQHTQAFYENMDQHIAKDGFWQGEVWNKNKNGDIYCERKCISAIYDDNGNIFQYVGLFSDITLLKKQQQELERMAHYDHLTKLPNRSLLNDRLSMASAAALRNEEKLILAYLDLDDFKPINDQYGHSAGDKVLKVIGSRLQARVRATDTVARIGGDEFIILLHNKSVSGYQTLLKRLLNEITQPIALADSEVVLSASFGVAHFPDDASSPEALLQLADKAMYEAKRKGKNQIIEYGKAKAAGWQ